MLSPTALAYVRARNADPMCSFGDFAAISHIVDVATAKVRMISLRIFKVAASDGMGMFSLFPVVCEPYLLMFPPC